LLSRFKRRLPLALADARGADVTTTGSGYWRAT
jgi:hypothetical protein